jgi:hypothetical protein
MHKGASQQRAGGPTGGPAQRWGAAQGGANPPPTPQKPPRWIDKAGVPPRKPVVRDPPERVDEKYRPPRGSGNSRPKRGGYGRPSPLRPEGARFAGGRSPQGAFANELPPPLDAQYRCPLHGSPLRGSHSVGNAPRTGRWRRYRNISIHPQGRRPEGPFPAPPDSRTTGPGSLPRTGRS